MSFEQLEQLDWQTCVALVIVLGAFGILARKTWKAVFSPAISGCGTSCNSCPASKPTPGTSLKVTKLFQLDSEQDSESK